MSLIERAMNKLNGVPDKVAKPAEDAASTAPEVAPEVAAKDAAVVAPQPGAAVVTGAAAEAPPAVAPAPVPAVPEARLPLADDSIAIIDKERLAAAGFLTPTTHTSRLAEEYQRIKRRLLTHIKEHAVPGNKPANLIMITSSLPGEGKTYTSVNLCISMAMEVDHTVLVIDTDIVKSDLSRTFGMDKRLGLYDLLADESLELPDLLVRTSIPNLVVLPAGQNRHSSTERLASAAMQALTREIAERYSDRVVIFDSPPILATTTAAALAPQVGQLVLVVEASKTKQETVRSALQALDDVQITGVVLNKSKQGAHRGYYYYYGYYQDSA